MSNYRRAGQWCLFFTVVTNRRQPLFQNEMARKLLNKSIVKTQKDYPN
jgi:REP element-mobilizing transposase RayT